MTTVPESRKFEDHLTSCGATPAGAQWVKSAVDPFHDVDLDVIGMPDSASGRSVVYAVTSNLALDAPTAAGAGSWDCHVAFTPMIAKAKLNNFAAVVKDASTGTEPSVYYPGAAYYTSTNKEDTLRDSHFLTACSVPTGQPTFYTSGYDGDGPRDTYRGLGVSEYLDDDGSSIVRITGAAFEVHNTTEDIYKSGSVTTYKISTETDECNFYWTNNAVMPDIEKHDRVAATISNGPPTTTSVAKLYNGHTWDAADGCLVPGVLDAGRSDSQKSVPRMHIVKNNYNGADVYWAPSFIPEGGEHARALGLTPRQDSNGSVSTSYYGSSGDPITRGSPPTIVPEMMVSGAYFSGLSHQTKLTLTLRVFVEVFPAAGNSLVPLAHPSNPYDAKALQCYQEIMSHMRSGYRVEDNDAGDFFRKAIAIARTIGRTLSPVMPPNVRAAIKAADAVAAKADDALDKAQKIEKVVRTTLAESNKITPRVRNRARTKGKAMP